MASSSKESMSKEEFFRVTTKAPSKKRYIKELSKVDSENDVKSDLSEILNQDFDNQDFAKR